MIAPAIFIDDFRSVRSEAQNRPAYQDLKGVHLSFVPNYGQNSTEFPYVAQGVAQDVFFAKDQVVFALRKHDLRRGSRVSKYPGDEPDQRSQKPSSLTTRLVHLKLKGSNPKTQIEGEEEHPGKFNILKGSDSRQWLRNLSTFRKLRYRNIYEGVDLVFYGNQGKLQYDFVVSPGTDPRKIRFHLSGASNVAAKESGELVARTIGGDLELSKPFAYQLDEKGTRQEVGADFRISRDGEIDFRIEKYDASRTLIIDPIFSYSTFLGGTHEDIGYSVKVDSGSNVYVAGSTRSVDFPVSGSGVKPTEGKSSDAFVTKIDPSGTEIIYSTVIGSNDRDEGYDLALDQSGSAYLVGETIGPNFPQQNSLSYNSGLRRTTFDVNDWKGAIGINSGVEAIAVSGADPMIAYVAGNGGVHKTIDGGNTWRSMNRQLPGNIPLMKGVAVGGPDACTVLTGSKNIVYKSTDCGENWSPLDFNFGGEYIRGIAIDRFDPSIVFVWKQQAFYRSSNGGATWVAQSYPTVVETIVSHPTSPGTIYAGTRSGLFKSTDHGLSWNAILGNSAYSVSFNETNPSIMYVGGFGVVFRSGPTDTNWTQISPNLRSTPIWAVVNDPTNPNHIYAALNFEGFRRTTDGGATWTTFNGGIPTGTTVRAAAKIGNGSDFFAGLERNGPSGGFALKLSTQGDDLVYSTIFGTTNVAVAVDYQGRAYVGGNSETSGIPLVNPLRSYQGGREAYFGVLSPEGNTLEFSTYFGGSSEDNLTGIAVDPSRNIYIAGDTRSPDFPTVAPFQAALKGQSDAWVSKIAPGGSTILYSTYFGGSISEGANAIFADPNGEAYFCGFASSVDLPSGSSPGIQATMGGGTDAFLAHFDASGGTLKYSSYIGGSELDIAHDITVRESGEVVVAGETFSIDFPTRRSIQSKSPLAKSSNRGARWRNDLDGLIATTVRSIAAHPTEPGRLIAATDRGVFLSTNYGEDWTQSSSGIVSKDMFDVAYSKSSPNVVYAGSIPPSSSSQGGGIYKSTDGGMSWQAVNGTIPVSQRRIYAVAVSPTNPDIVFAGSNGFGAGFPLFRSLDGGQNWSVVASNVVVNINDIVIDNQNPSVVYVGAAPLEKNFVRSLDGGNSWQIAVNYPTNTAVVNIEIDPTNSSKIFVGTSRGLQYSDNGGNTWQAASSMISGSTSVALDPTLTSRIYAGTQTGFFVSEDGAETWQARSDGLIYPQHTVVFADAFEPGVLYSGVRPYVEPDAFVSKLSPDGRSFVYSTTFGSKGDPATFVPLYLGPFDYAHGVAVSPAGSVFVTGYTRVSTFPTTAEAVSTHFGGLYEGFAARLDESRKIVAQVLDSSGNAVEGVEISLAGADHQGGVTELDGKVKFAQVPMSGHVILAPRKPGYSFSPPIWTASDIQTDTNVTFQIANSTETLSGRVTRGGEPVNQVTIDVSGAINQIILTDPNGYFSLDVPSGGDIRVTASKQGLIFQPSERSFENVTSDIVADFESRPGFKIAGSVVSNGVGMGSVPINLSGSESIGTLTAGDGSFGLDVSAGATFTIRPISPGFRFEPPFVTIQNLSALQFVQFAAFNTPRAPGSIVFAQTGPHEYWYSDQNLKILLSEGSINLTNSTFKNADPAWSPDGRRIAFASDRDGNWEIYIMNANGSNPIRVTYDPNTDREPSWSPDGSKLVFTKQTGGTNSVELYLIGTDGTSQSRLTNNLWYEYAPAWSPDGSEIAFVSEQDGDAEIFVITPDGSRRRRITSNALPDRNPAWSPDGSRIAFDSGVEANREIWSVRRDGTDFFKITSSAFEARSPSFSPDGSQIAFVSVCNSPAISTISVNGGAEDQLTECGAIDQPDWQRRQDTRTGFDYDGDGKADLSIRRPTDNVWHLLRATAGYTAMQWGETGDKMAPADYDGDGKTDVAVFRPSNGTWYVIMSQTGTFQAFGWGQNGDVPVPTDKDNDGKADLVVYRESNNTWYTRFSNGTFNQFVFGEAGDKPMLGDFDGDGKGDIAVFRPSNNNWYIIKSSLGFFIQTWGEAGDIPTTGDFDGDGKTDQAVFRPSTGQWFLSRTTAGFASQNWGQAGDIPVAADYDGDGKTDMAVFRPSNSNWYIIQSSNGILIQQFGVTGDVPTESAFIN